MAATATETFEFSVSGAPTLNVHNNAGSVTISAGSAGQVRVVATKRAHGGMLGVGAGDPERVRIAARQEGDTVLLDVDYGGAGLVKNVTVDFDITLPTEAAVEVEQNAGDVRLSGIAGRVRATINAGDLNAEGVALAEDSRVRVNAGDLEIAGRLADGASFDGGVNAGNIRLRLPANTPATLDARTTAGGIQVSGGQVSVSGAFAGRKAAGPLGPNPTSTIHLKVDAGSISVIAES